MSLNKLLWCDEEGDESGRLELFRKELVRKFNAGCSQIDDGIRTILKGRPDLAAGQPHPHFPDALVKSFNPSMIGLSAMWRLDVQYSTDVDKQDGSPLSLPVVIVATEASRTEVSIFDSDGKIILNAAGDLVDDPAPEVERFDVVFSCKKNIPTKWPSWMTEYAMSVNSDAVKIRGQVCEPETLRFILKSIGVTGNRTTSRPGGHGRSAGSATAVAAVAGLL